MQWFNYIGLIVVALMLAQTSFMLMQIKQRVGK